MLQTARVALHTTRRCLEPHTSLHVSGCCIARAPLTLRRLSVANLEGDWLEGERTSNGSDPARSRHRR